VLTENAIVHYDFKPRFDSSLRRLVIYHFILHPNGFHAQGNRLVNELPGFFCTPKDCAG
jgi:hypothetical protein